MSRQPYSNRNDLTNPIVGALAPELILAWQLRLIRSDRGIDELQEILTEIKAQLVGDNSRLMVVIDEMWGCAERHLCPQHKLETVEAIFNAAFPVRNDLLDDIAIAHDRQAEIRRLAAPSPPQYDRQSNARPKSTPKEIKGQGRRFELPEIEPWPVPVNGVELLDEICRAIRRYVVMKFESVATLALWAMHTHCFNCFGHSPRAAILSPEMQCGKTTTLDVLSCLVARPLPSANATVAAIFRIVEKFAPTLLIDEADTFLNENNELRGILNSGHRRGGQVTRTVGEDHEPRQFSTWAPAAIAMIVARRIR